MSCRSSYKQEKRQNTKMTDPVKRRLGDPALDLLYYNAQTLPTFIQKDFKK